MRAILDAGALVAVDRRNGKWVPSCVSTSATVCRFERAVPSSPKCGETERARRTWPGSSGAWHPLDETVDRKVGELLNKTRTSDVGDGHIAAMASDGDDVLTGDSEDIRHLLDA